MDNHIREMKKYFSLLLLFGLLTGCTSVKKPVARLGAPPPEALAITGGYVLVPTSATAEAVGGSGNVQLTVPTWTASSSDPGWLSISPTSGTGNATLSWSAAGNTGVARAGALMIGNVVFTVSQAGASVPPSTNAWLKGFGSTSSDTGKSVIYDASGNIIVVGNFYGTVSFGGDPLTSAGSTDVFVAKYSSAGAHIWSKRFGGPGGENVQKVVLDAIGNIFLGGDFVVGSVVKLSPTGDFLWIAGPVTSNGFNFGASCYSIAIDSQGNAIITGGFQTPFTGAQPLDFGNGAMLNSSVGSVDVFIAKYAPSGTCLWAKGYLNGDAQYGTDVALDHDNILVTGYAFGAINLGGANLVGVGYGAFGFLAKLNPSGGHIWSRRVGIRLAADTSAPYARARKLTVGSNGDVAVSGEFRVHTQLAGETIDGGANGLINGTATSYDMFLSRYAAADGHYLWAVPITGNQLATPQCLVSDAQNNIVMAGLFQGVISFGANLTLTTAGFPNTSDGFTAKYSSTGTPLTVQRMGGTLDQDAAFSVAMDTSGGKVITGSFQGTANFGLGSLTSAGQQDIFVWKMP